MKLDPARYADAELVDPSHRLPWGGRLFGQGAERVGVEIVDLFDSTTHMLIAGGSIRLVVAKAVEAAPAVPLVAKVDRSAP